MHTPYQYYSIQPFLTLPIPAGSPLAAPDHLSALNATVFFEPLAIQYTQVCIKITSPSYLATTEGNSYCGAADEHGKLMLPLSSLAVHAVKPQVSRKPFLPGAGTLRCTSFPHRCTLLTPACRCPPCVVLVSSLTGGRPGPPAEGATYYDLIYVEFSFYDERSRLLPLGTRMQFAGGGFEEVSVTALAKTYFVIPVSVSW